MQRNMALRRPTAGSVWIGFGTLIVIYALIAFFFLTLLLRLAARWKREDLAGTTAESPERGVPYGPRQ